ncbi:MAG TPA: AAA family ATPase [Acidimicrobiales bacterium]|nr:AAA family ATPase [Acidimicrobiales bacterium]
MNLFEAGLEERLRSRGPLASRLRPTSLDDVVGQDHLLGPRGALRALVEARRLTSIILWGPAGTGKTTIARLLAEAVGAAFESSSAVSAGVKDVREAAERARRRLAENGVSTVLLLDFTSRPIGVRLVRSRAQLALWDTPPGRRCTPHWWREHRDVDAGGRPSGAARESSRRAALLRGARHGHGFCPRPS